MEGIVTGIPSTMYYILLLCNKLSHFNSLKMKMSIFSVSEESGNRFTEQLWLRVCQEVVIKLLARATVISRLKWAW